MKDKQDLTLRKFSANFVNVGYKTLKRFHILKSWRAYKKTEL